MRQAYSYYDDNFDDAGGDEPYNAEAARAEHIADTTARILSDCIKGQCPEFWQSDPDVVVASTRRAFSAIGLTDAERWQCVERDVLAAIEKYAKEAAESRER